MQVSDQAYGNREKHARLVNSNQHLQQKQTTVLTEIETHQQDYCNCRSSGI